MLSYSTLLVFFTFAMFYLFKIQWQRAQKPEQPSLLPGPKPWPIVGNLPELIINKKKTSVSLDTHLQFLRKQDAIFASISLTMATDVLSKGTYQWRKMKRVMVNVMLSQERHRWLHEKRVEEADSLVLYVLNRWKNGDEGGLVDLRLVAQHYCCNVTRKLIFNRRYLGEGKADGGPGFEEEEYIDTIFAFVIHLYSFCISDYLPFLRGLGLEGHEKIVEDATRRDGKKHESQDLLDVFVSLTDDSGTPLLSADEIKAQVNEIMITAVDNPSNNLEWALAEMLNNPETLEKARDELDTVVGKDRLACAREAFRLHPIAQFNPPHGSHVIINRVGIGRNPKVWDEPCEFKPELVLAEPDLRLFTFSRGRTGCPGVVLGSSMTTMMFARPLQRFDWSIPTNQGTVDLCPGRGVPFLAKPLLAVAKPRLPPHVYSFSTESEIQ
ncbi:hypothetical protein V6Z12_D07G220600 [Gossypium hirsutum]